MKRSRVHDDGSAAAADPVRWRDMRPPSASPQQQRLFVEVRALPSPRDLDDAHLADIRRDVLAAAGRFRSGLPMTPHRPTVWLRMALFALVFLALGSLATTLAARSFLLRIQRTGGPEIEPLDRQPSATRGKTRRWRMTTRDSAEIELRVAPEGAEIAVVDGDAELSGPSVAAPITLSRGESWRESDAGRQPPLAAKSGAAEAPSSAAAQIRGGGPSEKRTSPPPRTPSSPDRVPAAIATTIAPRARSELGVASAADAAATSLAARALEPPPLVPLPTSAQGARGSNADRASMLALTSPGSIGRSRVADGAAEAFLVTGALRTLRIDGLPSEALAKLDEHRRRFPNGVLAREAALARVEALLKLGRRRAALDVLDGIGLTAHGADRSALLARGELRADGERCSEARRDFDQLLDATGTDGAAERALYARARCSVRAQDWVRARADLQLLRQRFPDGSRRADTESLLRQIPQP